MPELPDVTVYLRRLEARVVGRTLERVRLASPFVLRTAVPPLAETAGQRIVAVERVGKRIVLALANGLFVVVHLMIAGRFRWAAFGATKAPNAIAFFDVRGDAGDDGSGTLVLTEAGTRKRASIHVVPNRDALRALDAGGIDVLASDRDAFADRLVAESRTVKRALTDPRLFSGIGNAYADEILHRARMSPVALTRKLGAEEIDRLHAAMQATLRDWIERLDREAGAAGGWPAKVTAFHPGWPSTAATACRAPTAAPRCSASSTPTTRPTTAPAARRAASCSPTARSRACSRTRGRSTSTTSAEAVAPPRTQRLTMESSSISKVSSASGGMTLPAPREP
jgi:formamidopyrimidine-DNA glycosylase